MSIRQFHNYNTGPIFNVLLHILRPALPEKMRIRVGNFCHHISNSEHLRQLHKYLIFPRKNREGRMTIRLFFGQSECYSSLSTTFGKKYLNNRDDPIAFCRHFVKIFAFRSWVFYRKQIFIMFPTVPYWQEYLKLSWKNSRNFRADWGEE